MDFDGAIAATTAEMVVPYSLTLQWLESNPNQWPETEAALLRRIEEFCLVEVEVSPDAVVDALKDAGMLEVASVSPTLTDPPVTFFWEAFGPKGMKKPSTWSAAGGRAASLVAERICKLLLVYRERPGQLPARRKALEQMVSPHTNVKFRCNPRAVLDELEANEFLQVDANSDAVRYDGPKIVSWQEPPRNKGFGIGSFLLVILIILMMTPGALQALGIY